MRAISFLLLLGLTATLIASTVFQNWKNVENFYHRRLRSNEYPDKVRPWTEDSSVPHGMNAASRHVIENVVSRGWLRISNNDTKSEKPANEARKLPPLPSHGGKNEGQTFSQSNKFIRPLNLHRAVVEKNQETVEKRQSDRKNMTRLYRIKPKRQEITTMMEFDLPKAAEDWCLPTKIPPLPYNNCQDTVSVNAIQLYGGLTNSLKFLLLGAILSFEEDRCFVIDYSQSQLSKRKDARNLIHPTFMDRYFEPIGLPPNDEMVQRAVRFKNIQVRDWHELWDYGHNRRTAGQVDDIESINFVGMEGHRLKRIILRRMWRPLPHVRQYACARLQHHIKGIHEFLALSIQRGDKGRENFQFVSMGKYVAAVERAVPVHFGGKVPLIFVATDDCRVLGELRTIRPEWMFASECNGQNEPSGFVLADMMDWTIEDTDEHFSRFFVELYAMAIANYWIGAAESDVSWWVHFMRMDNPKTFELLETPGMEHRETVNMW